MNEYCACDEKAFYGFFKEEENHKVVTKLYGKKAKKARALGIWPPNKRKK